jgi:hypothetical protein
MTNEIATDDLKEQILAILKSGSFDPTSILFEVQDDGQCIQVYVPVDGLAEADWGVKSKHIAYRLNHLVPSRADDNSWFVFFTSAGEILESYFGGDESAPDSGLPRPVGSQG